MPKKPTPETLDRARQFERACEALIQLGKRDTNELIKLGVAEFGLSCYGAERCITNARALLYGVNELAKARHASTIHLLMVVTRLH